MRGKRYLGLLVFGLFLGFSYFVYDIIAERREMSGIKAEEEKLAAVLAYHGEFISLHKDRKEKLLIEAQVIMRTLQGMFPEEKKKIVEAFGALNDIVNEPIAIEPEQEEDPDAESEETTE